MTPICQDGPLTPSLLVQKPLARKQLLMKNSIEFKETWPNGPMPSQLVSTTAIKTILLYKPFWPFLKLRFLKLRFLKLRFLFNSCMKRNNFPEYLQTLPIYFTRMQFYTDELSNCLPRYCIVDLLSYVIIQLFFANFHFTFNFSNSQLQNKFEN